MSYLALDLGSSFVKAAMLDTKNSVIYGREKIPSLPILSGKETRHETDAELVWQQVKNIIDEYVNRYGVLEGILLSTQMHGFVITDKAGLPVTPFISWQDNRSLENYNGESWYTRLGKIVSPDDMTNTGLSLKPNLGLCKLFPLLQENTVPPHSQLCTLGSYIIRRLTGNNVCHITNAAPMGLVDIVHKKWDQALIEKTGCGKISFPEITAELGTCGIYSHSSGGIPVFPDLGDHQACFLGSLSRPDVDVNINIGTAGLIGIATEGYCSREGETRPLLGNYYLRTARGLFGGRDFDVLFDFLVDCTNRITGAPVKPESVWKMIEALPLDSVQAENSLRVENKFYTDGAIIGIDHNNFTLPSLFNALYASAAKTYVQALKSIDLQGNVKHIVYSGGAASKNPPLMRRIAEESGCSWECSPVQDEVMLGLYRVALLCNGECHTIQDTREKANTVRII